MKKDKVPKWSKAAFQDKFNIMKGKLENSEDSRDKKYNAIDTGLARLQRKLREGSALETGERGSNRVSALAEELFADKRDVTDDNSTRSSEVGHHPRKKSSIGKILNFSVHFRFCLQFRIFRFCLISRISFCQFGLLYIFGFVNFVDFL